MICGKHLWQLCNIQSHRIRTSSKPWWSIMAPSMSQTSANWCSHPRGSAGSIKAWQRRHWKPLDATFLKSLPSFCPRDKQGSLFQPFLDFCRHKLFGYLEVWQRSLPLSWNILPFGACHSTPTQFYISNWWMLLQRDLRAFLVDWVLQQNRFQTPRRSLASYWFPVPCLPLSDASSRQAVGRFIIWGANTTGHSTNGLVM